MEDFTLVELDRGVLSVHVEGAIPERDWRRLVSTAVLFLKAQGGGRMVLPHTPSLSA